MFLFACFTGLSFANLETLTFEQIEGDIVKFFDTRVAASFNFTIPDTNNSGETTIKVVCNSYNTTYNNDTTYSCSATFRRVYEA